MSRVPELCIADARIVDGTGALAFEGSVFVAGNRIHRIVRNGERLPAVAKRIDAGGRVLAPGFIDPHQHSDLSPFIEPWMDSYLRQGVTTAVVGNCGWSAVPPAAAKDLTSDHGVDADDPGLRWATFEEYLAAVDDARPAINIATLIGHGGLRKEVMGLAEAPTDGQMDEMAEVVEEGMRAGAVGLSTGLVYQPNVLATTDEVVELARVIEPFGGIYASHIRGENRALFAAVDECIDIGRRAGVPSHISHLKLEGEPMWGRVGELLDRIDSAREGGADVSTDQYPYTGWESILASLLPPWAPVEGLELSLKRDPERLRAAVEEGDEGWESSVDGVGWDRIVVVAHTESDHSGRSIAAIAADRGGEPFDAFCELLLEDPLTWCIGHAMHEDDVRTILARPDVMVGSDGTASSVDGPLGRFPVHPRYYGTFPRVLGRYARDESAVSLEDAIRKMTSLPADRFRLGDRGRVAEGAIADLVLFDPERVNDLATFEEPHVYADGIDVVVVGGRVAWDGAHGARNGRAVRRDGTE
ncbi:MAG: D-aminoacylase [Actinomycetota bacterium]